MTTDSAGDFAAYLRDSHAAGILRLDQIVAEATESLDEIMRPDAHAEVVEEGRAETIGGRFEQEPDAAPCSDKRFHDEHLWSHPDGALRHCLGVHDLPTMPIAATKKDADNVPGFPSARIYVNDEDKIYEHDGTEWNPVDG